MAYIQPGASVDPQYIGDWLASVQDNPGLYSTVKTDPAYWTRRIIETGGLNEAGKGYWLNKAQANSPAEGPSGGNYQQAMVRALLQHLSGGGTSATQPMAQSGPMQDFVSKMAPGSSQDRSTFWSGQQPGIGMQQPTPTTQGGFGGAGTFTPGKPRIAF